MRTDAAAQQAAKTRQPHKPVFMTPHRGGLKDLPLHRYNLDPEKRGFKPRPDIRLVVRKARVAEVERAEWAGLPGLTARVRATKER